MYNKIFACSKILYPTKSLYSTKSYIQQNFISDKILHPTKSYIQQSLLYSKMFVSNKKCIQQNLYAIKSVSNKRCIQKMFVSDKKCIRQKVHPAKSTIMPSAIRFKQQNIHKKLCLQINELTLIWFDRRMDWMQNELNAFWIECNVSECHVFELVCCEHRLHQSQCSPSKATIFSFLRLHVVGVVVVVVGCVGFSYGDTSI